MLYYNAAKNWGAGPEREQADVLQVALEDHGELNNNNKMPKGGDKHSIELLYILVCIGGHSYHRK
jgi:hypothetical protein